MGDHDGVLTFCIPTPLPFRWARLPVSSPGPDPAAPVYLPVWWGATVLWNKTGGPESPQRVSWFVDLPQARSQSPPSCRTSQPRINTGKLSKNGTRFSHWSPCQALPLMASSVTTGGIGEFYRWRTPAACTSEIPNALRSPWHVNGRRWAPEVGPCALSSRADVHTTTGGVSEGDPVEAPLLASGGTRVWSCSPAADSLRGPPLPLHPATCSAHRIEPNTPCPPAFSCQQWVAPAGNADLCTVLF